LFVEFAPSVTTTECPPEQLSQHNISHVNATPPPPLHNRSHVNDRRQLSLFNTSTRLYRSHTDDRRHRNRVLMSSRLSHALVSSPE